jgi:ABC-type glycerol-3-phosphate transport system substrate-binding protein
MEEVIAANATRGTVRSDGQEPQVTTTRPIKEQSGPVIRATGPGERRIHVTSRKLLAGGLAMVVLAGACSSAAATPTPAPTAAPTAAPTTAPASQAASEAPSTAASEAPASPTPLAPDPAEAVIPNVESGATINFWTFYLSPTFDNYIKETIARFQATYPGVTVNWEDHQATFQADLNNAFAAGSAPDVINLSVSEGWVSDYAGKGLLLPLDGKVPDSVKNLYFPGLWKEQLVNGVNYQFPWYQGLNVDLLNKAIFTKDKVDPASFPTSIKDVPAVCKTFATAGDLCTLRLTMSDLLAQMTYEGNVKVISDDGKQFTFDSPEGVAWLQMYVDMVNKDKSLDTTVLTTTDDRVGLNAFIAGGSPFYATGPNLARQVKDQNATLYGNLGMVQQPLGLSGVAGKGLMSISVKADTKYPNASMALAQFFTNPRSMVEFSKQVAIYPSSPSAYDDPFFSSAPATIEDSARPLAKSIISTYADIVPTVPSKADVNDIVSKAIQSAIFGGVDAQKALTDAVTQANKLIK